MPSSPKSSPTANGARTPTSAVSRRRTAATDVGVRAPAAARVLARASKLRPTLALVLGSGFGSVLERVEVEAEVSFAELPGFPPATVAGHAGKFVFGKLGGVPVLVQAGRVHFYEGHAMDTVAFPVRVLAALGVRDVLLTNAAGGINGRFRPGDFMRLTDHINFMGANPLRGPCSPGLPRFLDLTQVYDPALGALLDRAAKSARVRWHRGVYLALSGPTYETPAEIRAFGKLGADAVGMSTVPEAIVARHQGLRVAAVSCISNAAAGLSPNAVSHEEVLATAKAASQHTGALLEEFARSYGCETANRS